MNNILTFGVRTEIDRNLSIAWTQWMHDTNAMDGIDSWTRWLREMLPTATVSYTTYLTAQTTIEFESEEHKNWFLLEWS